MELNIAAIIASLTAVLLAIISLVSQRMQGIINTITLSRLNEYAEMRSILNEFAAECLLAGEESEHKKELAKARIELHFRHDSKRLIRLGAAMEKCCNETFSDEDYAEFIRVSQLTLHWKWMRIKQEAGINPRRDEKKKAQLEKMRLFNGLFDKP